MNTENFKQSNNGNYYARDLDCAQQFLSSYCIDIPADDADYRLMNDGLPFNPEREIKMGLSWLECAQLDGLIYDSTTEEA